MLKFGLIMGFPYHRHSINCCSNVRMGTVGKKVRRAGQATESFSTPLAHDQNKVGPEPEPVVSVHH